MIVGHTLEVKAVDILLLAANMPLGWSRTAALWMVLHTALFVFPSTALLTQNESGAPFLEEGSRS